MPRRSRSRTRKGSRKPRRTTRKSRSRSRSRKARSHSKKGKGGSRKFLRIGTSPIKGKKYRAYFSDGSHTDFGAKGYSDFTKHRDPARRQRYINRHRKRENWSRGGSGCKSAGSLSRFILWGKGSLRENVAAYKRRCG